MTAAAHLTKQITGLDLHEILDHLKTADGPLARSSRRSITDAAATLDEKSEALDECLENIVKECDALRAPTRQGERIYIDLDRSYRNLDDLILTRGSALQKLVSALKYAQRSGLIPTHEENTR